MWVRDSQIPFARSPWPINFVRCHPTFLCRYYGICCISHFGAYNFEVSLRILEKLYTSVVGNYCVLNYPLEPHFSVSSPNRNNCSNTNYIETTHRSEQNSYCFQNLVHITRSARSGLIQVTQNTYTKYSGRSNVYWTVHHCNSWRIRGQLDVTCYFISLLMCSTCFGH